MLTDSMTLEHMTDRDIAGARKVLLQMLRNEDAVGSWTDRSEVRQTGCSIHVRYEKRAVVSIDGRGSSNAFLAIMLQSPALLFQILAKLFDVSEEEMPALLEEARAAG